MLQKTTQITQSTTNLMSKHRWSSIFEPLIGMSIFATTFRESKGIFLKIQCQRRKSASKMISSKLCENQYNYLIYFYPFFIKFQIKDRANAFKIRHVLAVLCLKWFRCFQIHFAISIALKFHWFFLNSEINRLQNRMPTLLLLSFCLNVNHLKFITQPNASEFMIFSNLHLQFIQLS